jgi:SNF2 family DNA or RNA helicase
LDGTKNTSKINKVINIIVERKDNNNKKIIFCTFRSEIDYIEERLKKDKIKIKKFDGRTNENERKKILEDKSLDILILQIQTGCEGLNLQHFNEVYFVSSHWNPAIEDQAIARVYRIGQKKDIYIFKFTMNNFDDDEDISLEKYIINVQNDKRELRNIIESN